MQSKREANSLILYPSYISILRILKGNRPRDYRYTISRILRVGTEDWDRMAERKQFSDDLEFGVTRNWNSALKLFNSSRTQLGFLLVFILFKGLWLYKFLPEFSSHVLVSSP